ncbi:TonB-dependent receptor [Flavobacterium sp.]|uniref:TonB-dependent receptor n=1 Tax=Flavobacterium sp. TaxID=239 RepID=UPI0026057E0F|nr:TonB-dependent receptor [Flavobacterium sp.]
MIKKYFIFFFFCLSVNSFSQSEKIDFEYSNLKLKSILSKLENENNFSIYYIDSWFKNDTILNTKSFKNEKINIILENILKETPFNFYIDKNNIYLSENQFIFNELPNEILKLDAKNNIEINSIGNIEVPIFEKEFQKTNDYDKKSVEIIGKQIKNSKKTIQLKGIVTNVNNKKLSDITLSVKDRNISTITNQNGEFLLELPTGLSLIEVESITHEKFSKKIMLYNDGVLNIKLSENINIIEEVIVNTKAKEKLTSTKSGITSIDIENIKNIPLVLGERDIFKVATILPGIKTTGEGSAGYNVRGGKEDQNLILIDDAVIYNPAHFFGFFSAVNPFSVKKADIYKGSIPTEFGGRLSSVFDITTKSGNKQKLVGEGGIGPVTSNLTIETPIVKEKSSLLFAGRATYSGWIIRSLNNESLKKSEASFYDGILKYDHKFNDKNSISTTLHYSNDRFSVSSDSLFNYNNRIISLNWNHKFNSKINSNIIVTSSNYNFGIDYNSNTDKNFKFKYSINENQFISKFRFKFNNSNNLLVGINSKLYNVNPGELVPYKNSSITPIKIDIEKGLESAFFISDEIKISDKFSINTGFRLSNFLALGNSIQKIYEENLPLSDATVKEVKQFGNFEVFKTYTVFEPRLSARLLLFDDYSIKASYDKTSQFIHLLSNNTTQSPTDTWKLSDLNVKPQIAEQISFGIFKNIDSKNLELSIEGYYKKISNFLDYKVGANIILNENVETELLQGKGKSYGVEFLIKKTSGKLNGWIGYTYSRSFLQLDSQFNEERVNNGAFFPSNFDKPHDLSIVGNYKLTKRYSISSNFIYQTGRPITYPVGAFQLNGANYVLYSDRNKYRIPDYFRLDVGVNIEGSHKIKKLAHSFVNVSVYNILGINNPYSVFFVSDNGRIKAYKTSIFAIPIPTVTYNFKF